MHQSNVKLMHVNDAPHINPHTGKPLPAADPTELAWGARLLRGLLLGLLALVAVNVAVALARGAAGQALTEGLWLLATAVLLWNVWRGSLWSWRIAVALCFIAGMLQIIGGLFLADWLGWLFAFRGLAFVGIGLYLVADGPLRRVLERRWAGLRAAPATPANSAEAEAQP